MSDAVRTEQAAPAPPEPGSALGFGGRLSDRLNPILVREVQQALYGRAFLGLLALSTVAVVVLGFTFAALGGERDQFGRQAFGMTSLCLVPLALLFVPLQTFMSMRQEVHGGTAEQLTLTRLRPRGIVVGKVLAGLVQFTLLLAVFAPVLATTFLLRGIDVPSIVVGLALLLLLGLAGNAFAAGMASVRSNRFGQQLFLAATFLVLLVASFGFGGVMVSLPDTIAGGGMLGIFEQFMLLVLAFVLLAASALSLTIGVAALSHAYENRSAPFRLFALGMVLCSLGFVAATIGRGNLGEALPDTCIWLVLLLAPVWGYACCEDPVLSPRVRAHVPAQRWRALLCAPFVPGASRGVLFLLLLFLICLGATGLLTAVLEGDWPDADRGRALVQAWGYAFFYGSLAAWLRGRFGRGGRESRRTFAVTLCLLAAAMTLPWVLRLVTGRALDGEWLWIDAGNPATVSAANRFDAAGAVAYALLAVGLLAALVYSWRAIAELLAISAERRAASAPPPARGGDGAP